MPAAVDFGAVFESAPDGYLVLAPDAPRFTIVATNQQRLRATMTRREDVVGRPLFEVFPDNPTDPGATGVRNLRASLDEVLRTRAPHRMPLQKYDIRSPDGTFEERYWDPLNTPVFDDRGELCYIIHRVEDVTERVRSGAQAAEISIQLARETVARAEEARARKAIESILQKLRESKERYRLLVDMIPQNIWTTSADGHHSYFSRRWYDYSGATPEESLGEGWLEYIHPDDRERTLERWQHSLDTGEPYSIEYRFRGTDGEYHWFLGKATPLRNESGQIVEWFGTATDITDRKQLDAERERHLARERDARAEAERRRDELERVTESRARLIRGFSHDVQNPLGAADGYLHLMGGMNDLTEQQQEKVGKVRRSIKAALNLIEDLLELARVESGEIEIDRASIDLRSVAEEAVDEYRAQAEAQRLSLSIELPREPPVIESDASRIRQVVGNLLSNAVKYTKRGGITVRVDVRDGGKAPGPGAWIALDVSDTGPGIPEQQQSLLFHEFRRLEPTGEKGTGIGLAISLRIARALGGDVTVQSESGKGSTFTLWLPADDVSASRAPVRRT